jgi:hypothetical protein
VSAKHRRMIADNRDWRKAFVEEIGYCMVCSSRNQLCVHEMCCGAFRQRSVPFRELCLVVCWHCNYNVLPGMKLVKQLCYKMLNDRWHFDIDAIREAKNNGRNPIVVTMSDVRKMAEEIGIKPASGAA